MNSISTFNSRPVLTVDDVNLVYRVPLQRNMTWRDMFARLSTDPMDVIAPRRERLHILKDIQFKIYKGERVGLLGVNGAGKTSLCRMIARMFNPTTGSIKCTIPVRAIFDTNVGIQPELTGRENADLLAAFLYPMEKNRRDIVDEALQFSGLGHFVDVPYKLYSNGMQSRLYLSLVSSRATGLLILDEVFEGADVFFREKIADRIMALIEASGAAIFVSHSFDQIHRVCTRVLVLNQSEIVYDGPPDPAIREFKKLKPA
jgi:ABC-2 type transport system ATP-binding protein